MSLLRKMFGPSKSEIWAQIAEEIGGEVIEGGFWKGGALRYRSGEWELLLDTFVMSTGQTTIPFTRMRAPFVNKDDLHFKIYREGFFSPLRKFFGMQDIQLGDPHFDDKFIIKGNDEVQIARLLDDQTLKDLIDLQPKISFEIRDDEGWFGAKFPDGVDELYYCCAGIVKDRERLKNLFDLFACTLERLVAIDSAYETDPEVRLK